MKKILFTLLIIFQINNIAIGQNIIKGTRFKATISPAQVDFINNHFEFVNTSYLSAEVRAAIQGPELSLYRSIQDTWPGYSQFLWEHINANENMFCHYDSLDQSENTRILTIWGSWLMDGNDLVDPDDPDAMNHWINYYAVTASNQIDSCGYDGLFVDAAAHSFSYKRLVNPDHMPWNYNEDEWREGRRQALEFIKFHLPDKTVVFNGLHNRAGEDSSLVFTDGGMWEDFAYSPQDEGDYQGIANWWAAIQCIQNYREDNLLFMAVKKSGLIEDYQARMFSVASYLLVSNENVVLSLSDWTYHDSIQYYPEYDISIGEPIGDFELREDTLFTREFADGLVLVNPTETYSKTYNLENEYYQIVPIGGGIIDRDATYDGYLSYELVSGEIEIPPVCAVILKDKDAVGVDNNNITNTSFTLTQNYPNPFNSITTISYQLPRTGVVRLSIYNIAGQLVETLVNEQKSPGSYSATWYANDVSSGLYFYKLTTENQTITKKILLLK